MSIDELETSLDTYTPVPEIVSSAFLLILGFFIGQTGSDKGKSDHTLWTRTVCERQATPPLDSPKGTGPPFHSPANPRRTAAASHRRNRLRVRENRTVASDHEPIQGTPLIGADGAVYYVKTPTVVSREQANALLELAGIPRDLSNLTLAELNDVLDRLKTIGETAKSRAGTEYQMPDGTFGSWSPFLRRVRERRMDVTARISTLARHEAVDEFEDAVKASVADPKTQHLVSELAATMTKRLDDLDAKLHTPIDDGLLEMRKIEAQRKKWEMWWSLLQREPVAVLVGGILLLGFSVVLVVAMFLHTVVPEVLTSMVLLILGFFFGQTTSGKGKSGDHD
ncbi:hypothetical protein ACWELJ_10125 [Nocardia sp. NPDC004582]